MSYEAAIQDASSHPRISQTPFGSTISLDSKTYGSKQDSEFVFLTYDHALK